MQDACLSVLLDQYPRLILYALRTTPQPNIGCPLITDYTEVGRHLGEDRALHK